MKVVYSTKKADKMAEMNACGLEVDLTDVPNLLTPTFKSKNTMDVEEVMSQMSINKPIKESKPTYPLLFSLTMTKTNFMKMSWNEFQRLTLLQVAYIVQQR